MRTIWDVVAAMLRALIDRVDRIHASGRPI
jgi:hypothetical protein